MTPLEEVLEKLGDVRQSGDGYAAHCPAHGDTKSRHLTISEAADGRVLAYCHKGCSFREIFQALGMDPKDAFPKPVKNGDERKYELRDHTGRVVALHRRKPTPTEDDPKKKRVWWETPDGKSGLGGLKGESLPLWGAEAISSVPADTPLILCEGEKAAFALTYRKIPAVGTVTGAASTPSPETLSALKGRTVVLWPDADEDGVKHMQRIGKLLCRMGIAVRWFEWRDAPEKGDAADHPDILRGGDVEGLREVLYAAPAFRAPHDPATDGAATFAYVEEDYAELLKLRRKTDGVTGIRTGIPKIDQGIHGLNKKTHYLIAALTNVGKSVFAGQIALTAAQNGYRVLLQTPEMSAVQYLDRFSCYVAGVDYFKVQRGEFTEDQADDLRVAAHYIATLPLVVDEYGSQPIKRIRANIEMHEPELLVVDYLQFLDPDDKKSSRVQQVSQLSRDLAQLKKDYSIPVVTATQLNRESAKARTAEAAAAQEPILADLRDSGQIEQDADIVMMVHRPQMLDPDIEPEDEEIKIFCRKNRMGQTWHTTVRFVPGQQWFTDKFDAITGRAV